jgi:threonine dehydrogenase-like Zn-dependent dehydrogenase
MAMGTGVSSGFVETSRPHFPQLLARSAFSAVLAAARPLRTEARLSGPTVIIGAGAAGIAAGRALSQAGCAKQAVRDLAERQLSEARAAQGVGE